MEKNKRRFDMSLWGSYQGRKLNRIEPEDNNGIGVSTAYAPDEEYETALLDARGAHPVQRYHDKDDAKLSHYKWVEFAKNYKGENILKLGCGGVKDQFIILKQVEL